MSFKKKTSWWPRSHGRCSGRWRWGSGLAARLTVCLRTAGLPHTLGRWHSWSGRGGRGGRGQTSPPPLLILLKGGRAGASGRQGGRPLLHRTGSHSPASPPQRSQGPSGEPGSSPRPGGLGVCFQEGPAPNAFLMQTEASGHWPAGPPRKGAATCWAPPSPAAPPSPTSLPCRSRLGSSCSCRLLPFPGPALAMVLTAGSWGDTDGPAACPSPPFPWDPPCHSDGAGLASRAPGGCGTEMQPGRWGHCDRQPPDSSGRVSCEGDRGVWGDAAGRAGHDERARPASAVPCPPTRLPRLRRPASGVPRPLP